jgi:capreomycidine synthase
LSEIRAATGDTPVDVEFRDSPSTGDERLRAALVKRFQPGSGHRVMVTHGSTESIFLAVLALIRPGDEVIVSSVAYQALTSVAEAAGARLVAWTLDPRQDFDADLARLRSLIGPRTAALIVNFPHNPTGRSLTGDQYRDLLSIVDSSGVYLLWDGAFAELVYDAPPLPDPSGVIERCVSFGTASKAYGLPGLRLGWCFAPAAVIGDFVRIRDYVSLSVSPLVEHVGVSVFENADRILGPRLALARENRRILLAWLRDNADIVAGYVPEGGVTVFPRIIGVADTRPLCTELADQAGVLTVPGDCFGQPGHIRIGYGGHAGELRQGLAAFATAIRQRATTGSHATGESA